VGQVENLLADWQSALFLLRILFLSPIPFLVSGFHHRRLPHIHVLERPVFLTWRLRGSLPPHRFFPSTITSGRAFVAMDQILDRADAGPLHLRRPDIAQFLVDAMLYRQIFLNFELHAYVVMANHVHALITPHVEVSALMQSLKKYTARKANQLLGLTGQPFWQDESYDRLVRDESEFRRIVDYIELNPVKAGLVTTPEAFRWSSAYQSGLTSLRTVDG
jgi:putative transposase